MKSFKQPTLRKVTILANTLVGKGWPRKDAFKAAWQYVKENGDKASVVRFVKMDGSETTRVVSWWWTDFQAAKGGAPKPGMCIWADLAKVIQRDWGVFDGYSVIISAHKDRVIEVDGHVRFEWTEAAEDPACFRMAA